MTLEFLTQNEQNALHLEDMYSKFGYDKYKVNRFEEYAFYMENESFLTDRRVLTFSGANGKLFALKPDVTTSIVKNCVSSESKQHKIYYNESVFRIPKGGDEFKEIHQLGVEYIGEMNQYQTLEILNLAIKSLETISPNFRLCLSNTALLLILMNKLNLKSQQKHQIIHFLTQKNTHDLYQYLENSNIDDEAIFKELLSLPSDAKKALETLESLFSSWEYEKELTEFKTTLNHLFSIVDSDKIFLDFSHIPSTDYYSGLVFSGYLDGLPQPALTGGRYDDLLEKMGLYNHQALGFAVDLSVTHKLSTPLQKNMEILPISPEKSPVELIQTANKNYSEGKTFRFTNT